jgi:cation diffusion facilitator CzcD-associated flavoprotein CzcO
VPSHVYSLSFEQNPNWSRRYAPSQEIQEYLLGVVEKHNLRDRLRLNTEVREARFDEESGTWALSTNTGETFTARVVIAGPGGFVNPAYPDIEGLDSFAGDMFHTARWNHEVDLGGKRVAVIGTGASAIQVVPSVAAEVAYLSVFQRTAAWVMPKQDKVYSERWKRMAARFPSLQHTSRLLKYWTSELNGPFVFLDSKRLSKMAEQVAMQHLHRQVSDRDLRKKLTPTFEFGCKRVLISGDYLSTFERENVELVTERIRRITSGGIVTEDGALHEVDVIVLATGFLLGLTSPPFRMFGVGGRSIEEAWSDGVSAYKGMTVSGFPNWFTIMGPNTGPGHTSVLVLAEAQMTHAVQAIKKIRREDIKYMDVRQDVQDRYNERLQARMKHMAWSSGCKSWYLSEDGKNHTLYPGFAAEYVLRSRKLRPQDYEITRF